MNSIKVDCIYFPAILKQKINREHLISLGLISPQNLLNNAQIACHLSHITILKKFLKSSAINCLIFEDDISMPQVNKINLPEMLSLIPSDYDIIYLGRCWDSCRRSVSLNRQIVKCHAPQCFHSYGVSREGAKKIIKYTKALIKPPDLTISEYIRSGKITAGSRRRHGGRTTRSCRAPFVRTSSPSGSCGCSWVRRSCACLRRPTSAAVITQPSPTASL